MIDMRKPTKEDYKKFVSSLYFAEQRDNAHDGYYLIASIDGVEKLVQIIGKRGYLYTLMPDNSVDIIQFVLDDEYDLSLAAISKDYVVSIDKVDDDRDHDEFSFINNNNTNIEEFDFKERKGNPDPDGYDGYVVYVQYNEAKDTRLMMIYQHMIQPQHMIYDYHLKNPSYVIIDKNIVSGKGHKKERLVRKDFKYLENPVSYTLATIKDHGLFKTINEGAVNINLQADFSRYYHIVREKEKEIRIAFPFGSQYTIEEVNSYIKELGFNVDVPEEIVKFYNGNNKEFKEIVQISRCLKELYEYAKANTKKIVLEMGDNDGSNKMG